MRLVGFSSGWLLSGGKTQAEPASGLDEVGREEGELSFPYLLPIDGGLASVSWGHMLYRDKAWFGTLQSHVAALRATADRIGEVDARLAN
jgi:hypothetical protein